MVDPWRLLQLLLKTRQLPTVTQEQQISLSSLLDPQQELVLDLVVDMLLVLVLELDLLDLLVLVLQLDLVVLVLQLDLVVLDLVALELGLDLGLELALELVLAMVLAMELVMVLVLVMELEAWWLSPTEQLCLLRSRLLLPRDLNTLLPLLPAGVDWLLKLTLVIKA